MKQGETSPGDDIARTAGAPDSASVLRIEHIRLTSADAAAPVSVRRTQGRLRVAGWLFIALFGLVAGKLALATVVDPMRPKLVAQTRRPEPPPATPPSAVPTAPTPAELGLRKARATITDRNGEILAISLPTASVFANPDKMIDANDAAEKLHRVLPQLDTADLRQRLAAGGRKFVYLARHITPRQQIAINDLGIPGIEFEQTERRGFPQGRVAAHVIGGIDVDGHGVAGIEKFFDDRLRADPTPLKLSVDIRVQQVVRDELLRAMTDFNAIGAAGIVLDVRTGEVIGMVSLPDYDANHFGTATNDERLNRATFGRYEPGSTFKLQDAALALDSGTVQIWNGFDATSPIHIGRFTISDFEGKKRWL